MERLVRNGRPAQRSQRTLLRSEGKFASHTSINHLRYQWPFRAASVVAVAVVQTAGLHDDGLGSPPFDKRLMLSPPIFETTPNQAKFSGPNTPPCFSTSSTTIKSFTHQTSGWRYCFPLTQYFFGQHRVPPPFSTASGALETCIHRCDRKWAHLKTVYPGVCMIA